MERKIKRSSLEEFKKTYIYEIIINPFKLKNLLFNKYGDIEEDFDLLYLDAILFSKNCHFAVKYREYLIWDYVDEFLKRYYTTKESEERLPKIANYYKNYLRFFCNPFFKDLKNNELIQVYGDDKAKIYYKNNYGNYNKAMAAIDNNIDNNNENNNVIENNAELETKNVNKINSNNKENIKEDYISLIFNTTVRSNIDNNIITKSSLNQQNENTRNYDSFFESSFSKAKNKESNKNLSIGLDNNKSKNEKKNLLKQKFNNIKNANSKKSFKESFIDLLNNYNEHSFTYDYITDDNSFFLKNNINQQGNFDIKTSFISSNKIKKSKPADKNNKNEKLFDFNAEENHTNKSNKNECNDSNYKTVKKPSRNDYAFADNLNELNALDNNKNDNDNDFIVKSKNSGLNIDMVDKKVFYKEQINEQSLAFKKMYNDLLKTSTNKLIEKQNILNNIHQINSNKNISEKNTTNKKSKNNLNIHNSDSLKFSSNKNENLIKLNKEQNLPETANTANNANNQEIITDKNNFKYKINYNKSEINKNIIYTDKNNNIKSDDKRVYSIKNSTNNYNIEGNNNVVINISPRMDVDYKHLQQLNNMNENLDISPEKILYNITNRVGSPIMNSIVNINIKPILQVNNNQSNVRIFNSNANVIKNEKHKNSYSEHLLAQTINPTNKKQEFSLANTKFLEFKNNKLSQSKSKRISSLSNNANKSKEIANKLSQLTNNINYDNKLNTLNSNFSLNKNHLISSIKHSNNANFTTKNSLSQSGTIRKTNKTYIDSDKRNQLKTKSFDRNNSQANFLYKNNHNKPKSSNFVHESCLSKNNNFECYENAQNKVNSKDKQNEKLKNAKNLIDVKNFNQDFNEFTNEINKKLLSNFYSDKGLSLLSKHNENKLNQNSEANEQQRNMPNKIGIASANFNNDIFLDDKQADLINFNYKDDNNENYFFKLKDNVNKSEKNIKRFNKRSNTLGNSNELSMNSSNNLNCDNNYNNSKLLNSRIKYNQNNFSNSSKHNEKGFDRQSDVNNLKNNKNQILKKTIDEAILTNSQMNFDFSQNKVNNNNKSNNKNQTLSNLNNKQNKQCKENKEQLNSNAKADKSLHRSNINKISSQERSRLINHIDHDTDNNKKQLFNFNSTRFAEFQKNVENNFSSNIISAINKFKNFSSQSNQENNNKQLSNLDKLKTLNYNASFKDQIESNVYSNYNNNNIDKNDKQVKINSNKNESSKKVFANLSNTKLNNYLLNSNNLASINTQSLNNQNILSNNSSNNFKNSTINYQNTNSHKISNSIKTNKFDVSQTNFNSVKILSNISQGSLIDASNKNTNTNSNKFIKNNNVSNHGKESLFINKQDNKSGTKKISIFKNNLNFDNNNNNNNYNNINLKLNNLTNLVNKNNKNNCNNSYGKEHRTISTPYNFSHSPAKSKSGNKALDVNNLIYESHSRNKSNKIFKLNTNPSNNSKVKERNNNSGNKSISMHQGTITNDNANILNMKLFDYIKNQEYVDLLKETVEYNNNNHNNNNNKIAENSNRNKLALNNHLNFNKHVKNNKSVNLNFNFNKNLSKDSKKANSKTSSLLNNLNINYLEKTDNSHTLNFKKFDVFKSNNSKEKASELKNKFDHLNKAANKDNNITENNKNNKNNKNILETLQYIKEFNEAKKIKLNFKAEISKANNFINNKVLPNNKKLEKNSKGKTMNNNNNNNNNDVWLSNPYIINPNNLPSGKNIENNFEKSEHFNSKKLTTSKNRSIDANLLLNNNAMNLFPGNFSGNKFFELSNNKIKDK